VKLNRGWVVAVAIATVAIASVWTSQASAIIRHIETGGTVSYQPLRGAARPFDVQFTNLEYSGGPVMPANTNYTFYWSPSGLSAYPAEYTSGINQYLTDLGHDSGGHQNVDSVSAQYNDSSGAFAAYKSQFAGQIVDTDPYPASQCPVAPPTTHCFTDAQIQAEIGTFLNAHHLPRDLEHEYFFLTPPNVENCFDNDPSDPNGPFGGCSAGEAVNPVYCAFHSNSLTVPIFIYSVDPFVSGNPGCDDGNHPNGVSDGALEGGLSHEHNESITDPLPNSTWTDIADQTGEIGDKCDGTNGTPLGVHNGADFNQLINGHFYWYQTEWSNQGHACLQRFTMSGSPPSVTFKSALQSGLTDKFTASASSSVADFNWQWNDAPGLNNPDESTSSSFNHTFAANTKYLVGLTVYTSNGTSTGTGGIIVPGASGFVPGFSFTPAKPLVGSPVTFKAQLNRLDNVPIQDYSWDFGDGGTSGSSSPTHAFATADSFNVRLTMFWSQPGGNTVAGLYSVKIPVLQPTATTASGPATGSHGTAIPASAIASALSGGTATPTGTISFRVFGPQATAPTTCTSGGTAVGTAAVAGNGTYHPSAGFTPPSGGKYFWYASYGGNGRNAASASTCGSGMAFTTVS
jgi:PKD repeat protein